ncbi:MAG: GDP-mannose 4,6-dehydratase, partial [Desulfocucumaceae bacterium]
MRALITGVSGFVGSYLAEELLSKGYSVCGTTRAGESLRGAELLRGELELYDLDLENRQDTAIIVNRARPDVIFHLAAMSSVAASWRDVDTTFRVNVLGTAHLLDAIREAASPKQPHPGMGERGTPRVLVVGSGEEYGSAPPEDMPLTEESPLRPDNPYAVSKAAQAMLCRIYVHAYGLPVIYMRPFNHIGPFQGLGFVAADFAMQIAEIEVGLRKPVLHVGNLEAQRDFCDVRDIVRAYVLAAERGRPGEVYNVASGKASPIRHILSTLLSLARVPIGIEADT